MADYQIDDVIKAAARVLLEPVLSLLQNDPHQWSTRPCETCRAISSIVGRDFGCILHAKRQVARGE